MSFSDDLKRFSDKTARLARDVFVDSATEVHRSVVEGSEITGAPGQPVDEYNLKPSWILAFNEETAQTTSNVGYAQVIEDNTRGATLRSKVGGFHSVALTRLGWPRIVEAVLGRVPRNA